MKFLALVVALAVSPLALAAQGQGKPRDDIPAQYRPPAGMCRIWIEDVAPAQQPAPTDCPTAIRRKPPNARVVFGEEAKDSKRPPTRDLRGKPNGQAKPERVLTDPRRPPPGTQRPPVL